MTSTPLTYLILALTSVTSLYALYRDRGLIDRCAFRVDRILTYREDDRMLLSGFVHVDVMHLLFNMLTLYFFGPFMELTLGTLHFAVLYFGSELAANLLTLALKRSQPSYASVGASGAISGVVFAFCLYRPLAEILVFPIPFGIPAFLYAFGYLAYSMVAMGGLRGGIAHEAHIGGALGGVALTMIMDPQVVALFLNHFSEFN